MRQLLIQKVISDRKMTHTMLHGWSVIGIYLAIIMCVVLVRVMKDENIICVHCGE